MKLALVCSTGGHLYEMFSLKKFWEQQSRFWVTFQREDAQFLLSKEKVYFAYYPTNRHVVNFFRNCLVAWRVLRQEQPRLLITTGAGVSVPFIYIAKILKIKTVYIESLARVKNLSLTGRMVYRLVDRFYVQWPSLEKRYKRAHFQGQVI